MFVRTLALALLLLVGGVVLTRPSSGSGRGHPYVVKPYDTLWSIAVSHYGGDPRDGVAEIQSRNHLRSSVIRVGERLVLP
jgi:LysM repeat protein